MTDNFSAALQELTRQRDRAQRYLDTAEVILVALDLEGRVILVNRAACRILGWPADELIGREFIEVCVPERVRALSKEKLGIVHAGDDCVIENPILTHGGEERLIEWRTSILRDEDDRLVGTLCAGTDVTERNKAEAQGRLQSAALDAAANAIVITNRTGEIEWVNPAFCALTGYSAEEALGRNPAELVKSGQHDQAFYQDLWKTILSGQVWRGEMVNRRKDGSLYTEEQAITPVRDAAGEISHFVAVKLDTTERRRAEAEFRQRARLSALIAALGLALADGDELALGLQRSADALVSHLEVALVRIWTVSERDQVLELQARGGLHPETDDQAVRIRIGESIVGRIARDRQAHVTDALADDPDVGQSDWIRRAGNVAFAGLPLLAGRRVVGVMALFADHPLPSAVTAALPSVAEHIALGIDRHRSAEALRGAEARMRFVLEAAGVGIWDMDFTTGVLQWSDILEAQYDLPRGTFAGTFDAFIERIHPDDRQATIDTFKAHQSGGDFTVQHRTLLGDGTVRWLSGAGRVVLGADGKAARAVGISLDVTERRTLEEQYQQAQKMEAIGRLAGGVAHDFNNLLTVILGYSELMLADAGTTEAQRNDLAEIHKAGSRAEGLTRQLLAFSRKQIIEPKLLDLSAIALHMQPMLLRLIGEDVEVILGVRPGLAMVRADRGQVEQIIMNLAVNARDAMPTGGTLTIETANVQLDEHYAGTHVAVKPGAYVVLTVSDTGTGMTPEVQKRVFEPFFTTKEVGKGTGLGLATVHGIVTQSGGTVAVYSEVGKGTSLKVYFPQADGDATTEQPEAPLRPRGGTQTVLVVEDAEGLRVLVKKLLQRQGYTVFAAGNAEEAVTLFNEHASIDVLLTDVVMPGASGPELTRRLIEQRPALKVIYMSGYTQDAIVHHGVLDPGIAFLHKPFTSDTLARKLREVLDR